VLEVGEENCLNIRIVDQWFEIWTRDIPKKELEYHPLCLYFQ